MSAFFLFYKKGTSLVELIAVIIIMGIIAGIAIPTTIAVINRQKRNAAKSSAQNVYSAAQTSLLEEVAAPGSVTGAGTGTATHDSKEYKTYTITSTQLVTNGDLEKDPFDSAVTFTIDSFDNTVTPGEADDEFEVNGVKLVWDSSKKEFTFAS